MVRSPHSVDFYRTVQELGNAAAAHDSAECDRLRAALERRLRISGPVRYEVVKLTYEDAVVRWAARDSAPRRQESVAQFVAGAPSSFPAAEPAAAIPSPAKEE